MIGTCYPVEHLITSPREGVHSTAHSSLISGTKLDSWCWRRVVDGDPACELASPGRPVRLHQPSRGCSDNRSSDGVAVRQVSTARKEEQADHRIPLRHARVWPALSLSGGDPDECLLRQRTRQVGSVPPEKASGSHPVWLRVKAAQGIGEQATTGQRA